MAEEAPAVGEAQMGDGGQIKHKLAEAALQRRGNATVMAELKDAARVYDPVQEKKWQQKYNYFSGKHMRANYRTYARARHDPFNKDPSWGQAIMASVGKACTSKGIAPRDLFKGVDLTGDGNLNRPEMKRVICNVLPTLSDMEIAAIFDTIDKDHSGEVNVSEFCQLVDNGKQKTISQEKADRWRNPIHRMKRFPPARIEGWDHVVEEPCQPLRFDRFCENETSKVIGNLSSLLATTPRALQHNCATTKYEYFTGGADSTRFRQQAWIKEGRSASCTATPRPATSSMIGSGSPIPDPGPDPRPGFLCDVRGQTAIAASRFAALTPRTRTAGSSRSRAR